MYKIATLLRTTGRSWKGNNAIGIQFCQGIKRLGKEIRSEWENEVFRIELALGQSLVTLILFQSGVHPRLEPKSSISNQ